MPKANTAVDDDYDYEAADREDADIDDEEDDVPPPPKTRKVKPVPVEDPEEDTPEPQVVRKAPPIARPPAPVLSASYDDPAAPSNKEFDQAVRERKSKQNVADFLERKKAEETTSVEDIIELLLLGDQDKIIEALHVYCQDNLGIKKAKKLLREARDAAKGRVGRIAGIAEVILDEFKSEQDEDEKAPRGRY